MLIPPLAPTPHVPLPPTCHSALRAIPTHVPLLLTCHLPPPATSRHVLLSSTGYSPPRAATLHVSLPPTYTSSHSSVLDPIVTTLFPPLVASTPQVALLSRPDTNPKQVPYPTCPILHRTCPILHGTSHIATLLPLPRAPYSPTSLPAGPASLVSPCASCPSTHVALLHRPTCPSYPQVSFTYPSVPHTHTCLSSPHLFLTPASFSPTTHVSIKPPRVPPPRMALFHPHTCPSTPHVSPMPQRVPHPHVALPSTSP